MKVRTAVIPVAGLGTRFLPATKAVPKEMIPIIDKPTIQYIVEEALASGIEHIVFITARNKAAIENHFDRHPELEGHLSEKGKQDELDALSELMQRARFSYVRQDAPRGLGHAIHCAHHLIGETEPFAVLLGDDVIVGEEPALGQMIHQYDQLGAPVVALQEVPQADVNKYGIVSGTMETDRLIRIDGLVEKPDPSEAPSRFAIIGRYILDGRVFGYISGTGTGAGGEIQLTDALTRYQEMYGYCFSGVRYDAGNKLDFLRATVEIALRRSEFSEPFRAYLKSLDL